MKKLRENIIHKGKHLVFKESIFENKDGSESVWESVERVARRKIVVMVAKLVPSQRFVLISQYRPAAGNYVLGLPAGLTDTDDIKNEALRELKEETGYTGKITEVSPIFKQSPAVIDDEVHVVSIDVDEKDKKNIKPVQELEPEEDIRVILAKKEEIKDMIDSEISKGHTVASGLWYFILGGRL
jgi:ADP-ribose pyrophosphatase